VTWLYCSNAVDANTQTLCSGPAAIYQASEYKVISDPAAKRWMKFQELSREWRAKRGATSSITAMSTLEAYQKIIGMGESAVPLILAQLKAEGDEPDQWFWALRMITGANPVLPADQGNFRAMAQAWIAWSESEEYAGILAT
jgi:hypothetical protein